MVETEVFSRLNRDRHRRIFSPFPRQLMLQAFVCIHKAHISSFASRLLWSFFRFRGWLWPQRFILHLEAALWFLITCLGSFFWVLALVSEISPYFEAPKVMQRLWACIFSPSNVFCILWLSHIGLILPLKTSFAKENKIFISAFFADSFLPGVWPPYLQTFRSAFK